MAAENAIRGGIRQNLSKAIGGGDGLGAAIGGEGEFADLVRDTGRLQLFFGFADCGHFRRGVHNTWDGVVIYMAGLAGDAFGASDRFIFSFMGQHHAFAAIAHRPNAGNVGFEMAIGNNPAFGIHLHANCFETEPCRVRAAANGDEHHIGFDHFLRSACSRFQRDFKGLALGIDADNFGGKLKAKALLGEDALELLGYFTINAGSDPIEEFAFEEMEGEPRHESYLWGNPAFACTYLLAQAFSRYGWDFHPGVIDEIDGLPTHVFEEGGGTEMKPCAEAWLTTRAADAILARGLIPLLPMKGQDVVRAADVRSVAALERSLAGRWRT